MTETLYAERPDVYDALYADKAYDEEVDFVVSEFDERGNGGDRALVVGCGTGEHSHRLVERGFDVTGVDKYEAMVERARTKSNATFRVGALPDLPVDGPFDLVFLPFTVVNHVPPGDLVPSLRAVVDVLADGGLLVFDQLLVSTDDRPRMATYEAPEGTYGRLVDVREVGDDGHAVGDGQRAAVADRYRWDSLVVTPDGETFVDTHDLTNYDSTYLVGVLDGLGLETWAYDWYDADDPADETAGALVYVGKK